MARLYTNNATSTLASSIDADDLTLTVASGEGALFPNPTGDDYFVVTLETSGGTREIVKVTARSTDTFTIVRAQEGTGAAAFTAGDTVELRATATAFGGVMREIASITTTGSQSSVSFTGIPGIYRDLHIEACTRGSNSTNRIDHRVRLNGATSGYRTSHWNRFGAGQDLAGTFIRGGEMASVGNSNADAYGHMALRIPNYAATGTEKIVTGVSNCQLDAAGDQLIEHLSGQLNTGAVTSIEVYCSGGAFVDGSVITLYGIGGV